MGGILDFLFGSPAFLIFGAYTVVMVVGLGMLLHLQLGLAGIGNFGVVGFWGLGLYAFGVLTVRYDLTFFLALLGATAIAGAAGIVMGWVVSNLDVDGVLGATLSFAAIVFFLTDSERDLTGGRIGLGTIDFPFDVGSRTDLAWLAILVVIVGALMYYVRRVHRAPYGRLLIATGFNEPLAQSLRKPTFRTKMILFAWTSAAMGLIGALYASFVHFLFPTQVTVGITIAVIVALVLGGQQRTWGALVGALLTIALFDIVIQLYVPLPRTVFQQAFPVAKQMIFGLLLIVLLLYRPLGILGRMRRENYARGVTHE